MTTAELLLRLWPIGLALLGGAFWIGVLDFRVRANTAKNKEHDRKIERQGEKQQRMEVDQAGWKSTLEGLKESIDSLNKKIDSKLGSE